MGVCRGRWRLEEAVRSIIFYMNGGDNLLIVRQQLGNTWRNQMEAKG